MDYYLTKLSLFTFQLTVNIKPKAKKTATHLHTYYRLPRVWARVCRSSQCGDFWPAGCREQLSSQRCTQPSPAPEHTSTAHCASYCGARAEWNQSKYCHCPGHPTHEIDINSTVNVCYSIVHKKQLCLNWFATFDSVKCHLISMYMYSWQWIVWFWL